MHQSVHVRFVKPYFRLWYLCILHLYDEIDAKTVMIASAAIAALTFRREWCQSKETVTRFRCERAMCAKGTEKSNLHVGQAGKVKLCVSAALWNLNFLNTDIICQCFRRYFRLRSTDPFTGDIGVFCVGDKARRSVFDALMLFPALLVVAFLFFHLANGRDTYVGQTRAAQKWIKTC